MAMEIFRSVGNAEGPVSVGQGFDWGFGISGHSAQSPPTRPVEF
jgi:hypothetical protein